MRTLLRSRAPRIAVAWSAAGVAAMAVSTAMSTWAGRHTGPAPERLEDAAGVILGPFLFPGVLLAGLVVPIDPMGRFASDAQLVAFLATALTASAAFWACALTGVMGFLKRVRRPVV